MNILGKSISVLNKNEVNQNNLEPTKLELTKLVLSASEIETNGILSLKKPIPTKEELKQSREKLIPILEKHIFKRPGISELFETVKDRFFKAPASGKSDYHSYIPGGLCHHTYYVINTMSTLRTVLENADKIPEESCVLVGFAHDLGKIGSKDQDYYFEQKDQWRRDRLKEFYTVNHELLDMKVPDWSLWWLSQFGVKLTAEEVLAIRAHEDYESFKYVKSGLTNLLRYADYWCACVLKI